MAAADISAEHILSVQSELGEGSLWEPVKQKLYWVDILGRIVHMYDPVTRKHTQLSTGEKVGTIVPMVNGNVLVALGNGIHEMDIETGNFSYHTDVKHTHEGSIGYLATEEIKKQMQKTIESFPFAAVQKAIDKLLS